MSDQRAMLITGASRGLGRHMAEHFLARGWRVMGCSRKPTDFAHDGYTHVEADITNGDDVKALMKSARTAFGKLDALVNNAGIASMNPIALTPAETAQRIMDVNFHATFNVSQAALRLLKKADAPRIVNLTTVAVALRLDGEAVYAASKSAVEMLTRIAAKEFAPMKITVNAVGPTPIDTDLIRGVSDEKISSLVKRQAIKRKAEPADVANAVEFFVKPASGMITGQIIYLGGVG